MKCKEILREEAIPDQSADANWGLWLDVRWWGAPNQATQCRRRASMQLSAVVDLSSITSGHQVCLTMIVRI